MLTHLRARYRMIAEHTVSGNRFGVRVVRWRPPRKRENGQRVGCWRPRPADVDAGLTIVSQLCSHGPSSAPRCSKDGA